MPAKTDPTEAAPIVGKADIDEIVGQLDDALVAAVIATGASREELIEAYAWLTADDALHRDLHHAPQGRVAEICELLEAEIAPPEER